MEQLPFDLPTGLTAEDCRRVKTRHGHLIVWNDSNGRGHVVGKFSVWGAGYQNISMSCRMNGHIKCRRAVTVLKKTPTQMDILLLDGISSTTDREHMDIIFRDAGIHLRFVRTISAKADREHLTSIFAMQVFIYDSYEHDRIIW